MTGLQCGLGRWVFKTLPTKEKESKDSFYFTLNQLVSLN